MGDTSLKEAFPRLFRLSSQQTANVSEIGGWVEGVWKWDLKWSRVLSAQNKE